MPGRWARDTRTLLSQDKSATIAAISWVEVPPGIRNLSATCEQSGEAEAVIVYGTDRTAGALGSVTGAGQQVFKTETTATYHTFTQGQYPRYLSALTSGTCVAEVNVFVSFEKEY